MEILRIDQKIKKDQKDQKDEDGSRGCKYGEALFLFCYNINGELIRLTSLLISIVLTS